MARDPQDMPLHDIWNGVLALLPPAAGHAHRPVLVALAVSGALAVAGRLFRRSWPVAAAAALGLTAGWAALAAGAVPNAVPSMLPTALPTTTPTTVLGRLPILPLPAMAAGVGLRLVPARAVGWTTAVLLAAFCWWLAGAPRDVAAVESSARLLATLLGLAALTVFGGTGPASSAALAVAVAADAIFLAWRHVSEPALNAAWVAFAALAAAAAAGAGGGAYRIPALGAVLAIAAAFVPAHGGADAVGPGVLAALAAATVIRLEPAMPARFGIARLPLAGGAGLGIAAIAAYVLAMP